MELLVDAQVSSASGAPRACTSLRGADSSSPPVVSLTQADTLKGHSRKGYAAQEEEVGGGVPGLSGDMGPER